MQEKFLNYINEFNDMPQEITELCEKILNNKEDFVDNITMTIELKEKIETSINKFRKEFKDQIEPKLYEEMLKPLDIYLNIIKKISNQLIKSKMQNMQSELDYIYVYIYEIKRTENMEETLKRIYNEKQNKTQDTNQKENENSNDTQKQSDPMYATDNLNQNKVPDGKIFNPSKDITGSNEIIYATQQQNQQNQHQQPRQQTQQQKQNKNMKYSYQVLKKAMEKKLEELSKEIEELNKIQNRTITQDNKLKGLKRTKREIQKYYQKIYPKNSKKRPIVKYRDNQIHQIQKEIEKIEKTISKKEKAQPSKLNIEREINQQKIDNLRLKMANLKKKQKTIENKQEKAVEASFKTITRRIETINNLKVFKKSFDQSVYYMLDKIQEKQSIRRVTLEPQFGKIKENVEKIKIRFSSRKNTIEDFKNRLEGLRRKRVIAQGSEPIKKGTQQNTKNQSK